MPYSNELNAAMWFTNMLEMMESDPDLDISKYISVARRGGVHGDSIDEKLNEYLSLAFMSVSRAVLVDALKMAIADARNAK